MAGGDAPIDRSAVTIRTSTMYATQLTSDNGMSLHARHEASLRSARAILPLVFAIVAPASVLELGLGSGTWLQVAADLGVADLAGVDGGRAQSEGPELPAWSVTRGDLDTPLDLGRRFDLVMTLETAQHINPQAAGRFVANLVGHGDVVLFSAAIPAQTATPPANGRWPAYWAQLFADHGYVATDGLRARLWLDEAVEPCYAQNALIFVRERRLTEFPELLAARVPDRTPLPLVHPQIFASVARDSSGTAARSSRERVAPPTRNTADPVSHGVGDAVGGFVTVIRVEEIAADPGILSSYASDFGSGIDATLVIYAPDRQPDSVLAEIAPALAASGLDGDDGPDAMLLCVPALEGDRLLAERATVVLGSRVPGPGLACIPLVGRGATGLLGAWAAGAFPAPGLAGELARTLLMTTITAAGEPDQTDNIDRLRYADGMSAPVQHEWPVLLAANLQLAGSLEGLWNRLDAASREVLVSILGYRVLGHRKIRTNVGPFARVQHVADEMREHLLVQEHTVDPGFLNWMLDEYDLTSIGFPMRLHSHPRLLINEFVLEQYRAPEPADVGVRSGDVVIDGGGCWGETALHFACLAGAGGRVHTFEFEPTNLLTLRRNLELNPELAARIRLHEHALWSTAGEELSFEPAGGGTRVNSNASADGSTICRTATVSIDGLVASGEIDRVDFIKLDVEGSELAVLQGAEATIRRFRPRLAISAYHRPDDLIVLPGFLDQLGLGYRYAIGHFTMSSEETVLFAWCDSEAETLRAPARPGRR